MADCCLARHPGESTVRTRSPKKMLVLGREPGNILYRYFMEIAFLDSLPRASKRSMHALEEFRTQTVPALEVVF